MSRGVGYSVEQDLEIALILFRSALIAKECLGWKRFEPRFFVLCSSGITEGNSPLVGAVRKAAENVGVVRKAAEHVGQRGGHWVCRVTCCVELGGAVRRDS